MNMAYNYSPVYIVSWKINLYICHNILKNNDGRYKKSL